MMRFFIPVLIMSCCMITPARADVSMVYETTAKDGKPTEFRISINGRWVRIDAGSETNPRHVILDTGYHRMYHVDAKSRSYIFRSVARMSDTEYSLIQRAGSAEAAKKRAAKNQPQAPAVKPQYAGSRKSLNVSGVRCRIVREFTEQKQVADHCMASSGALGFTRREVITVSRLFRIEKHLDPAWLGLGAPDERSFSVQSRDAEGRIALRLKSISGEVLSDTLFQIPKSYTRIPADKPASPILESTAIATKT